MPFAVSTTCSWTTNSPARGHAFDLQFAGRLFGRPNFDFGYDANTAIPLIGVPWAVAW